MTAPSQNPGACRMSVDHQGAAIVVKLAGSINMDVADDVQRRLIELIDSGNAQRMILDLAELDFIASSGLGAIIATHVHGRHQDHELVLAQPAPKIRELLNLTRLDKLFPIYNTLEEAINRPADA